MKKQQSLIFSVFSIILLLSIGLNPTSPNPDSGLFPLAYAISDPVISSERAGDYYTETHVSGKMVTRFGLPELKQDTTGNWVDAKITEDADFIHIDARTPAKISKNDCKLNILDFETQTTIRDKQYFKFQKGVTDKNGVVAWTDFDVSNAKCSAIKYNHNKTGSYLEYDQTNGYIRLHTLIAFYRDVQFPESFVTSEIVNFVDNKNKTLDITKLPEITDKFRVVHVTESTSNTVFVDSKEFVAEASTIKEIGKAVGTTNTTNTSVITNPQLIFDDGSAPRIVDFEKEKERLSEFNVKNNQNKIITEAVFEKDGFTLQKGESKTYDPTFGYADDDSYLLSSTLGTGTTCPVGTVTRTTATGRAEINMSTDAGGGCFRGIARFDMSSITGSSTIVVTNVNGRFTSTSATAMSGKTCQTYRVTNDPSSTNGDTLWTDSQDGTQYLTGVTECQSDQTYVKDLGTTADSEMQTLLRAGTTFFAFSVKLTDETRDASSGHTVSFADNNIDLEVTYHYASAPSARTGLSIGSATESTLTASWTNPTNFNNDTQPTISSQTLYRGDWGYPDTALPNSNGTDSGSLTGSIDMSALGNKLLYHFDYLNSANRVGDNSGSGKNATVASPSGVLTTDTFASSSGWTQTGTEISIGGGDVDFVSKASGSSHNIKRNTFGTLSTTFSVDFDFILTAQGSNCYNTLLVLSDSTTNPMEFNNDVLTVSWLSYTASSNDGFLLLWADGSTTYSTGTVNSNALPSTQYYLTLSRTDSTTLKLYIYTDSGRTIQITGSPIVETIPNGITDLDNIFIGGGYVPQVGCTISGNMDNVSVTNSVGIQSSHIHKTGEVNQAIPFSTSRFVNFTHSSSPMRGTNDWTFATSVYKNNTNPFTVISWQDASSNDFAIKLDEDSIALTKEATEMLNKTFTTNLGTDKWSHIAVTKSGSTICAYVNGTLVSTCATNSTSLSTPSNNMYYLNSNADTSTGLGIWMADEMTIFNTALSASNIEKLFDHTQSFTGVVSGISSDATSQQNTGLSASTTYCYQVSATNSVGESSKSSVACGTTSASSGSGDSGQGGTGGGGGSPTQPTSSDLLKLSILPNDYFAAVGQRIEGSLVVGWNIPGSLLISSATAEVHQPWISFTQTMPITIEQKGDLREGTINYVIQLPSILCPSPEQVSDACIEKKQYVIPVKVIGTVDGETQTTTVPITIDLRGAGDIGTWMILGGTGFTIAAIFIHQKGRQLVFKLNPRRKAKIIKRFKSLESTNILRSTKSERKFLHFGEKKLSFIQKMKLK